MSEDSRIIPDLDRASYDAVDAANFSTLWKFDRSPAHARHYMLHPPDPTPAMTLGTAMHLAVLEPDRFGDEVVQAPTRGKRSKAGRAEWEAFEAEHAGKAILSPDDYAKCEALRETAARYAAPLLRARGLNEATLVWRDEPTGMLCKGRPDRICSLGDRAIILDLKTTRNASSRAFAKSVADLGYHVQAAFYLDGAQTVAPLEEGQERTFVFLAVEKEPPYACALYALDDQAIEQGRADYRRFLWLWRKGLEEDDWPAYGRSVNVLSLPRWAQRSE